ncbi:hypothetical protein TVAG_077460 [Trichomonas vaginalis G3]|uniref:Uncharacterized protein n=1 Tax=Trichomonas vaginalis (strain ATCC PRA-98 / G3) TaxID=412133 RepID=A2E2V3_TRIV3|nr:ribonuclease inhibitor domain-containing protein [Trichomonas vaginalis G3]EAY13008.1 hypothetical protein TVAG_077460 [Trichomonas vaginalis G3]KAI5503102.1 ribonuclease inhibitor domain-containing protein [Trichomonas vaginalis G3]|eukprot:XP_001325231.1 hypothetical protein [Trichomonas vaginalis G3]
MIHSLTVILVILLLEISQISTLERSFLIKTIFISLVGTALEEVVFEICDCRVIESSTFSNSNIKSIIFNEYVEEIQENTFTGIANLKRVTFNNHGNNSDIIFKTNCMSNLDTLEEIVLPEGINLIIEDDSLISQTLFKMNIPENCNVDYRNLIKNCPKLRYSLPPHILILLYKNTLPHPILGFKLALVMMYSHK